MNDLKFAFRQLLKYPAFTGIAVLVLALGIGANTAIFSLINTFLFKPLVAHQPERLVGIYSRDVERERSWRAFSIPNFQDLRRQNDVFEDVIAMVPNQVGFTEGDITRRVFALTASANYFDVFGVRPQLGRAFLPEEDTAAAPVVIVSHKWWERHGADPGVLGQALRINGRAHTVVGVAPPGFSGTTPMFSPEFFFPLGSTLLGVTDGSNPLLKRDNHGYILVGRLKPGLDLASANAGLKVTSAQLDSAFPEVNKNQLISVDRLPRMAIATNPVNDRANLGRLSLVMSGLAGIVLFIACLNLANMLLARGIARRKEFAVRLAIGAARGQIIRQLLVEGFLLALAGGAFGLLLSGWITGWIARSIETITTFGLSIPTVTEGRVLLMTLATCCVATLFFALGPALRLVRRDINYDLKSNASSDGSNAVGGVFALRNLLVVGQVALSLALLVAAGLFVRSGINATHFNPGFQLEGGLFAELDAGLVGYPETQTRQRYGEILDRVSQMPGVASASLAATIPLGEMSLGEGVQLAGATFPAPPEATTPAEGQVIGATLNVIGPRYFETLGIPLQRGREFTRTELEPTAPASVAIVNSVLAARLWPGADAVGQRIQIGAGGGAGGGPGINVDGEQKASVTVLEVVGVVPPQKTGLFDRAEQPTLFLPYGQRYFPAMLLHVRAAPLANMDALMQSTRQTIHQIDPNLPLLKLKTLQFHLATNIQSWVVRTGAFLLGLLGATALLLSVLGVYGVKAYSVAQRTREIGIRMALGATGRGVLVTILREGAKLTLRELALGAALAVGVAFALGNLLVDVPRFDPLILITAPLVLAAASLLACWLPARRAAKVDPMVALRNE